jgi:signal transduction histidine kinase
MPQGNNEKIILNEIVENIHDLFRKRDDMDIFMTEPLDEIYVFADRNHLIRVLNNILKNAIQAIPTERRGRIDLKLYKKAGLAIVEIRDNGVGIPDSMKNKVFTPNFTTKSSGTGLGLAIAANMMESFNGHIRFTTVPGEGTIFYIEIPLMHVKDNFEDVERISLELS